MKNFFNILLVAILTVLLFNIFSIKEVEKNTDIKFDSSSYTVPATVLVKIQNYWTKSLKLNTCNDITIRKSWDAISFSGTEICKDLEVLPNSVETINYASAYKNFESTGKYSLEANLADGKKFTSETTISSKWTFNKIFSTLIYAPIYNLFVWLIWIFNTSLGWAIISVTIIIRLILLYPQHKSMVASKKLAEIQPKIKKLQEDYKNDQQVLGQKLFDLYKQEKVNPLGSCGFLLIQVPIILVLYNVILSIQDYSNEFYLYGFLETFDISSINSNFFNLDLLALGGTQGLILALVIWLLQFIQLKLSLSFNKNTFWNKDVVLEKKVWANNYSQMMPDPEMMNKFMLYVLPFIIAFATYNFIAWVWIYWWISTLFMIVQQLVVNKMLKK